MPATKPATKPATPPATKPTIKDFTPTDEDLEIEPQPEPQPQPSPQPQPAPQPNPDPNPGDDIVPMDFNIGDRVPVPDKKPGRPSNNAMRSELERVAKERKELEQSLERERAERLAEKERIAQLEKDLKEREVSTAPPVLDASSPEIRALADPWNRSRDQFTMLLEDAGVEDVATIGATLQAASKQLFALDPQAEDYKQKVAQIRSEIAREIPQDQVPAAMTLVREGARTIGQIVGLQQEYQQKAPEILKQRRREAWTKARSGIENLMSRSFSPPKELADADPLAPSVILRSILDADTDLSARATRIKQAALFAMSPPPEVDVSAIEDPREAEKRINATKESHTKMRDDFIGLMPEAILAYQLLPGLVKKLQALEENVGKTRKTARMKLEDEPEYEDDEDGTETDIRKFEPPAVDLS